MYCKYFGFDELPFSVTPDPRFNHKSLSSEDSLARLHYGIETKKGFILILGDAGTGKTTLLRRAMHSFSDRVDYAYIFNPRLKFVALLRSMLTDLGVTANSTDKDGLLDQLNKFVLQQHTRGRIVTCILDEAQGLGDNVLEELRLLGNLETDREKLIQIVLAGQLELEWRLERPNMRQFKQRITQRIVLQPLEIDEIGAYLATRLRQAGYTGEVLFDNAATDRISRYSLGIPRLINSICDNALARTWRNRMRQVTGELIDETAVELRLVRVPEAVPLSQIGQHKLPLEADVAPNLVGTETGFSRDAVIKPEYTGADQPQHRRLGYLIGLIQERFAFIALAAVFVSVLGIVVWSLMGEQYEARLKNVPPLESHSHARTVTVAPALPTARRVQNGDSGRSPDTEIAPSSSITQVPNVNKENAVGVREPKVAVHQRDENRPIRRTVFRVSGASFLRNKPRANAEVIATLRPGIRIEVTALGGEYFLVRALDAENLHGFVHKEDAFFEPVR